ncbi:MAG TPA: GDP-fucose synthetase [Deltaproteobacteria bacterium]|nr:GDP-fucose synthetase [Deltaproteobacteria bacterium]
MEREERIYIAGSGTLIGKAIWRGLENRGYTNLVGGPGKEPDLNDPSQVNRFFARSKPDYVVFAAGRSRGIRANQLYPADLMRENLLVQSHVIDCAYRNGVKKLLYLASSCCYPRHCPQPMKEESLLSAPLEPTNEAYALAKIAGIKLCQAYRQQYGVDFISAIPGDVFGPGDDFSLEDSHVVPALIRKMHEGKEMGTDTVEIWGSGNPRRDVVFVDDLADACIFVMCQYAEAQPINIGSGADLTIREIAMVIKSVVGYRGELRFDTSRPDGMPKKLLDSSRLLAMGWQPKTSLISAVKVTYQWFLQSLSRQVPLTERSANS